MALVSVYNSSKGLLTLWLEPLGEDRWLQPGETFVIRSNYTGDESAFTLNPWVSDEDRCAGIENVNVWVDEGDCMSVIVVDLAGNVIECGHQRPAEIDERWRATDEARNRTAARDASQTD